MKYKVNAVKKIVFSMMIMALAVAMMACEEATPIEPDPGPKGEPGAPGKPGGVPPGIDEEIGDVSLAAAGSMTTKDIDLDRHFYDPDGTDEETLIYEASSSDTDAATASVEGSTLTLTAVAVGTAEISVRAADVDGLRSRAARFDVTVTETVAPEKTGIPDQVGTDALYQNDDARTIDLATHFSHERAITYTATTESGAIEVGVENGTLTVTPVLPGFAIVTVTATADELSITDDFIVEVMSGSRPPSTPTPTPPDDPAPPPDPDPPENMAPTASAIPAQTMMTGDAPIVVDVAPFFSDAAGDALTFGNPVSSNIAVATVTLSGSTLTITAVAAGTSNLSVTATDPGGISVTGTVVLTVSEPSSSIPSTLELSVGDVVAPTTHELELPDGYTLQTADSSKVNVVRTGATGKGNEWRLTARSKTTNPSSVTVYVNDENNTEATTIEVTVLNSPPKRNKVEPSLALLDLNMVDIMDPDDEQGLTSYSDGARYAPPITSRVLYRTQLLTATHTNGLGDLSRFYTDADGDPLAFEIEVVAPHVGMILFKNDDEGFLYTITRTAEIDPLIQHVVYADILTERIDRPIGINIYANDGEAKSEGSVRFELRNEKPIPRNGMNTGTIAGNQAYRLTQLQEPGFFRNEDYGNRTGVEHIFQFGHATKMVGTARVYGFTFAHDFLEKLVEDGFTVNATSNDLTVTDHLYGVGVTSYAEAIAADTKTLGLEEYETSTLGAIYYEATVDGPITRKDQLNVANFVRGNAETGADAALTDFAITPVYPEMKFRFNSAGTGKLNITFGVWADPDADGTGKSPSWQTETRQIDFNIIGCISVGRIDDCP